MADQDRVAARERQGYRIEAVVVPLEGEQPTDFAVRVAVALDGRHVGPITVQPVVVLPDLAYTEADLGNAPSVLPQSHLRGAP